MTNARTDRARTYDREYNARRTPEQKRRNILRERARHLALRRVAEQHRADYLRSYFDALAELGVD